MEFLFQVLGCLKILGIVIGILLAVGFVIGMGIQAWIMFKWKILGVKPAIRIDSLIEDTVRLCCSQFVRDREQKATESGKALTDEEMGALRQDMEKFCRNVIDAYIFHFAMFGVYEEPNRSEDVGVRIKCVKCGTVEPLHLADY